MVVRGRVPRKGGREVGHGGSLVPGYGRSVARVFRPQRPVRASDLLAPAGQPPPQSAARAGLPVKGQPQVGALWGAKSPSELSGGPPRPLRSAAAHAPLRPLRLPPTPHRPPLGTPPPPRG